MPPKGSTKSSPVKRKADNNEEGRSRAASPKSMLWAHQLKQQHGYLLEKLNVLEDGIKKLEKRASRSDQEPDIGAIATKVQELSEGGEVQRARKEVTTKLHEVENRLEATIRQVAELTAAEEKSAEDKRKAFENEQRLVERIKDVEQNLELYQEKLTNIGQRINEDQVAEIQVTLDKMATQVREGDGTVRKVEEQLKVLEAATKELRVGQEQVAARVVTLEKSPPPTTLLPTNKVQTKAPTKNKPGRKPQQALGKASDATAPSKVSHKSRFARELADLQNSEVAKQDRGALQTNAGQLNRPIVRSGRGWVEIVEAIEEATNADSPTSLVQNAAEVGERGRGRPSKPVPSIEEEPIPKRRPGRPRKAPIPEGDAGDIARRKPSIEEEPMPKRGPGRPRKAPIPEGDADDIARRERASMRKLNKRDAVQFAVRESQATTKPPTAASRSTKKQVGEDDVQTQIPTETQANENPEKAGRKRKAATQDVISPPPLRNLRKNMAPEAAKKRPQLRRGQVRQDIVTEPSVTKSKRRGLTNVYSSPMSSSMGEDEIRDVTQAVIDDATDPFLGSEIVMAPPSPPKRRFIKQDFNDEELLRKMSAGALGS